MISVFHSLNFMSNVILENDLGSANFVESHSCIKIPGNVIPEGTKERSPSGVISVLEDSPNNGH